MAKKIIFTTGGTGGHIFPAINLMKHFFDKEYEVLLVTDERGNVFAKKYSNIKSYVLKTETLTGKSFFEKIKSSIVIFISILKSIFILVKEKPDIVFGLGGYVSFPVSFSSKILNLPLVIYENNMVLGRANRFLSKFSKKILLAKNIELNFPAKYRTKTREVGTILDKKIINYSPSKINNIEKNFSILVLGGSQGAEIFGKIVPEVAKAIVNQGYKIEIIQQCVDKQKNLIIESYKKNNIKHYVFEFEKNILEYLSSANLAITRCGASTTAELVHTGTPFIAVPLPNSIDNHQYLNAKYYENKGCCWLIEQGKLNKENLYNLIMETIKNKNKLEKARENMKKNYNSNVYNNVEKEIGDLIK